MRAIAGLVFDAIQENPAIAAGICTFAVAFSLVAGNALYGQRGGHPGPLFATRDAITTRSVEKSTSDETRSETRKPAPTRKDAQIPVPKARPDPAAAAKDETTLVRQTQEALRALGIYDGEVDGLYGPKTREAILRFERAEGINPTGLVSVSIAERLSQAGNPQKATKIAKQDKPEAAPRTIESTIAESSDIPPAQPASGTRETAAEALPASEGAAANDQPAVAPSSTDVRIAALVARIQIGLQNFGELEVPLDGQLGDNTIKAIRRFQERYGINADGQPSEALVDKLEQIGALRKS